MSDPVLLGGKLRHGLILLSCHLELYILVFSDIRDFNLLAECLEHTVVGRADRSYQFRNLGISLFNRFGLFVVIRRKLLEVRVGVLELVAETIESELGRVLLFVSQTTGSVTHKIIFRYS